MSRKFISTLSGAVALCVAAAAGAADSGTVSYQGVLRDATLSPVADGAYAMTFSIWDDATAGTKVWGDETHAAVATVNGMFSVYLGSDVSFNTEFADFSSLWLEISVDTGTGMEIYAPRVPLASVPYAQHATTAGHAATASSADNASNADNAGALDGRAASSFADAAHEHSGGDITTGTVPIAHLPVGATSSHVAPGNHTHTLNALSDVDAPGPGAGQALTWNGIDGWQAVGGYAIIRDVKPTNTHGGNSVVGWNNRALNNLDTNIAGVTLNPSTGVFKLPPGRYRITVSAPAYKVDRHQAALFNVSANAFQFVGTSEHNSAGNDYCTTRSVLEGRLNLAADTEFRVRHYTQRAYEKGFGIEANATLGVGEFFTQVIIDRY